VRTRGPFGGEQHQSAGNSEHVLELYAAAKPAHADGVGKSCFEAAEAETSGGKRPALDDAQAHRLLLFALSGERSLGTFGAFGGGQTG
jgi:hypothetical protein